jgi:thioredoxin reductase (NADPH)
MEKYDVIIVGTGPAGLAAGIYAGRRELKTLIIGEVLGGQMSYAHIVENYPGVEVVKGLELAERMKEQAEKFGCTIKMETVVNMELKNSVKKIRTRENEYLADVVILATGSQHRRLKIEGESKFLGRGVSYCSICDGPLFKGKKVAVIGGSDAAVTSAIYLNEIASQVYLIHRRDQLRAEEANQEKLKKTSVKIIWNSVLEKIEGDNVVKKILLKNLKTNEISELEVDGVFIEIGQVPTTEIAKKAGIEVNERGFIKVNDKMETNIEGVYAAGDVTGSLAQIVVAAAEGAIAATNAYLYLKGGVYGEKRKFDWGKK